MKKILLCMLFFSATAACLFAQVDKARFELFNRESAPVRDDIDDILNTAVGRGVSQTSKATYLEGYGAVFTLEASLAPTRNPFASPKAPAEVRAAIAERRKTIETKLEALLKQRVGTMQ